MIQSSLDATAIAYAHDHLGESEAVVKDSVLEIQQFLKDNQSINARSDQRSIVFFLRSCKFNVEQAKQKIKK